jgi:uncharacterized phage infection (PIP) family protein YhgE
MKQFFVLGLALLTLAGSGCATRGYARRQAREVNDRVSQVQAAVTAQSDKHATDVAAVNERIAMTDNKLQETASMAAQANANAAQANANAARADASAAQASASAARAEANTALASATAARTEATAARAEATAAQERAVIAQNTPPPAPTQSKLPATLPATGSSLPLIGLSGLLSLGAAGVLRLLGAGSLRDLPHDVGHAPDLPESKR